MNVRILLLLLVMLIIPAHAQETINEGQLLLNGYVDSSGKVLLTGYATPESLSYMSFLNGTQHTFDNSTNQLYAVTDMLTSKSADTWSLNFSLDGYYSDYSITFYLPPGSEITKFEIQPELNYQFQVREDSLIVSIEGYRVISPWIKMDYKLPTDIPGASKNPVTSLLSVSLIIILVAGVIFAFYRHRVKRITVNPEKGASQNQEIPEMNEHQDQEIKVIADTKTQKKEIQITGEMQKVIDTLSDKEKAIVGLLLRNGGSATQADIRYETGIPKSSLTGIINALQRRKILKKREYGRTNIIELSEWFLSEKKLE